VATIFWETLMHGSGYALIVTQNGMGYILGDFLATFWAILGDFFPKLIWSPC
jgi:hypothetical protein